MFLQELKFKENFLNTVLQPKQIPTANNTYTLNKKANLIHKGRTHVMIGKSKTIQKNSIDIYSK